MGSREHEELWVPAEELSSFNRHISGQINVTAAYFGDGYEGFVPDAFELGGKAAREQFVGLARTLTDSSFDLTCELAENHVAVFLNYLFWQTLDLTKEGIETDERDRVLERLKAIWDAGSRSRISLGVVR